MQMKNTILTVIALITPICTAAAAEKCPKSGYPEFSWDTVPLFNHTARWNTTYAQDQIDFIAEHCQLAVFEKMHGLETLDYGGQVETAIFHDARRIKAINPKCKVLFYFNAFVDNVPTSWRNEYGESPQWLLRDDDGEIIYKHRSGNKLRTFDITRPGMLQWWKYSIQSALAHPAIDGIFIDALIQIVYFPEDKAKKWGREKYEAMAAATDALLQKTQQWLPDDAIVINNGLFANMPGLDDGGIGWLKHATGAMVEHFGAFRSRDKNGKLIPEDMAREIELIQKAGEMGKIVLVKGWPGSKHFLDPEFMKWDIHKKRAYAKEHLDFSLAAYLVAAEKYAYFAYNWGWGDTDGWFEWYPQFEKPLGEPKGKATRDGWVYTRQFAHADVTVDLKNETADIRWK